MATTGIQSPCATSNRLLTALPLLDRERLLAETRSVPLIPKQVVHRRGEPLRHVYFPNGAVCSLATVMADGSVAEIATIGDEGMIGVCALHGAESALNEAFVRTGTSTALEMPVQVLTREMNRHGVFAQIMHRYMLAFIASMAQCLACNALHTVRQRCCRWLLMTDACMHGEEFTISQELLAMMLGTRRPTVSAVASSLQQAGVIRYRHGHVQVVDRAGLERASCACHRIIRHEFERLHL